MKKIKPNQPNWGANGYHYSTEEMEKEYRISLYALNVSGKGEVSKTRETANKSWPFY